MFDFNLPLGYSKNWTEWASADFNLEDLEIRCSEWWSMVEYRIDDLIFLWSYIYVFPYLVVYILCKHWKVIRYLCCYVWTVPLTNLWYWYPRTSNMDFRYQKNFARSQVKRSLSFFVSNWSQFIDRKLQIYWSEDEKWKTHISKSFFRTSICQLLIHMSVLIGLICWCDTSQEVYFGV